MGIHRWVTSGLAAASVCAFSLANAAPSEGNFKAKMSFVSNAPGEDIEGTAEGTAKLSIDLDSPSATSGEVVVSVASMKTGNDRRDEHLRGSKWLDATAHPDIRFKVTSATAEPTISKGPVKMAKLQVTGEFSLHGVTKTMTAPAEMKWKDNKMKVTTEFTVKLADFKVEGAQGVVGSKVADAIKVEVTLLGVVAQPAAAQPTATEPAAQ
jgi:polyisoprenoid-binding protein YceI